MAKQRYIRTRDKKGRFVSGMDLRRAVKREIWEKTRRGKVKKVFEQWGYKPLSRAEFKTRFLSRLLETTTPDKTLTTYIEFSRSRDIFVENTIAQTGFFDEVLSAVLKNRSPNLNFTINIEDIILWNGKHYPDIKNLNFAYNLLVEEMQTILKERDPEVIELSLQNIRNKFMGTIKTQFKKMEIQFSAKQYRNYNPTTGKKSRGAKKRKSIRSFKIFVSVDLWTTYSR